MGGDLTLALGDNPVFDADMLSGQPVWPAGNIASGIDIRRACLQEFVHHDAAIDAKPRRLCKPSCGTDTDADHDQIGIQLLAGGGLAAIVRATRPVPNSGERSRSP
jgi:hypothetical protein